MGGVQAAGQGSAHHSQRHIGLLCQSAADGGQHHEAGVAEHGDTGDIAHGAHGYDAVLLTNQLQNGVCHGEGGAGLFQNGTDDGAAQDDDADAGHDAAEAALDLIDNAGGSQAGLGINDAPEQADAHCHQQQNNERMHFQLGDCQNHQHNGDDNGCEQQESLHGFSSLHSFGHFPLPGRSSLPGSAAPSPKRSDRPFAKRPGKWKLLYISEPSGPDLRRICSSSRRIRYSCRKGGSWDSSRACRTL